MARSAVTGAVRFIVVVGRWLWGESQTFSSEYRLGANL